MFINVGRGGSDGGMPARSGAHLHGSGSGARPSLGWALRAKARDCPPPLSRVSRSPKSPKVPQPHSLLPATATPSSLRSKLGCSQQPQVGPGSQRFGVAAPRQAKPRAPVSAAEPICQSVIKDFRLYRKKKKWSPLFFFNSNLLCLITQLEWEGSCCL